MTKDCNSDGFSSIVTFTKQQTFGVSEMTAHASDNKFGSKIEICCFVCVWGGGGLGGGGRGKDKNFERWRKF